MSLQNVQSSRLSIPRSLVIPVGFVLCLTGRLAWEGWARMVLYSLGVQLPQ